MINVMVAEDNIHQNSFYCSNLSSDNEIKIVSRTLDGVTTLKEYLTVKPDVLLLDSKIPKLNGLEVIDNLCLDTNEKKKCNIIIITGDFPLKSEISNASKIYRIFQKPVNYDILINTIKEIGNVRNELKDKEIKNLLIAFNFRMYSKGTRYILDAIKVAYYDELCLSNMQFLYKRIGIMNNVKMSKIQRSIRSSIDVMNKHISRESLQSFFHIYDNDIITPKYFFTMVVDYFKDNN